MKKLFTLLIVIMLSSLAFGQHYVFDKFIHDGGAGDDKIYDICLDAAGNKYIAGTFKETVDFGNGVSITATDNADAFVAKYDVDGNILWANAMGGSLTDYTDAVAVDNDGSVITASRIYSSIIFGTDTLYSTGSWDVVVVKFDADGNYLWVKQVTNGDKLMDQPYDIQVDSKGNYVLIGMFDINDDLTLKLNYEGLEIPSQGERDIFVIKMDTDGNPIWGVNGGARENDYPGGLVIDEDDNIYFNGYYDDSTAVFGSTELACVEGQEVFLAKLDSNGTYQWAVSATGLGDDQGNAIEYADGTILITGSFKESLTTGVSNDVFESAGDNDLFVLAYTTDGDYVGGYAFGGEESAGASFLRKDGGVWSTDKDGIILALLAAEIIAVTGKDPGEHYQSFVSQFGEPVYKRIDAPASIEQKAVLSALDPAMVEAETLAGEAITAKLTAAPGNGAAIGGLKVVTENGWFAARPSGTEDIYKIYLESFKGEEHLALLEKEAKKLVDSVIS